MTNKPQLDGHLTALEFLVLFNQLLLGLVREDSLPVVFAPPRVAEPETRKEANDDDDLPPLVVLLVLGILVV